MSASFDQTTCLRAEDPNLNFGNEPVGTTSPPQTVTLTNTAKVSQAIAFITIGGTNPKQFAETNTCGTGIAAGASCTISGTFSPTGKGSKTATLQVGGDGATETVSLAGTGT